MSVTLVHTSFNSMFYSAATAIIRYIYIRSSLQPNIQAAIKRRAFAFKAIFVVEAIGCYNIISFYLIQRGKTGTEKLATISYQTCLDPFQLSLPENSTHPMILRVNLMKVLSLTQYFIYSSILCIIGFNLAIFKHLDKTSRSNATLSEMDQIKTRRRNLVSAKVGIYSLIIFLICGLIHGSLYAVKMELGQS